MPLPSFLFLRRCAAAWVRRAGQRAQEIYDWAAIIQRYEALWRQLAEIRARDGANLSAEPLPLAGTPWILSRRSPLIPAHV